MATMYCALCRRPVDARRQIGAGTVILGVLSMGVTLLAIPFYAKRCSICKSSAVTYTAPGETQAAGAAATPLARLADLEKRLGMTEAELETALVELQRLKAERDFYRQLLPDPAARGKSANGI